MPARTKAPPASLRRPSPAMPKRLPILLAYIGLDLQPLLNRATDEDIDAVIALLAYRHPGYARRLFVALSRMNDAVGRHYHGPQS